MKRFGLIGKPLSHSFSKDFFHRKFKKESIKEASYDLFELNSVAEIHPLIKSNPELVGLNVTIPFKQSILDQLDEVDETAKNIGAVNTICIKRNDKVTLKGYNTDVIGFRNSLKPFLAKEHYRALILGTGGAAKAVAFVLKQIGIPFYCVSRSSKPKLQTINYNNLDSKAIESFPIVINCTPLGMYPKLNELPPIALEGIGKTHLVYDLIYNPEETKLLEEAKKRGALTVNGLSMLKLQAEAAWGIWNREV